MWWLAIIGMIAGIALGLKSPLFVPVIYSKYLSVAILAALDSVFGGLRAAIEEHFDNSVFISGFFANACLAALLAYIGDRLGVELFMAAVVAFGVRIFQNIAIIRRGLLKKL